MHKPPRWFNRVRTNVDPRETCCPAIHYEKLHDELRIGVLGTVFFISPAGIFITAKHVVDAYPDGPGSHLHLVLLKEPTYKYAKVLRLIKHPFADIAIGLVDLQKEGWRPKMWPLASGQLKIGDPVSSFGYSLTDQAVKDTRFHINLNPDFYEGKILDYHPNGYGIAQWPVYSHTMNAQSGISGGPVFHQLNSTVYGVCCTGWTPSPGGTFTDIRQILDWPIDFVADPWNTLRGLAKHRPDLFILR